MEVINVVTALFQSLTTGANGFVTFLKDLLTSIVSIFYNATDSVMTDFGQVFLIAVAASLVFWGIGWLSRLFKLRS